MKKKAVFSDPLSNLNRNLEKTKDLWEKFKGLQLKNEGLSGEIARKQEDQGLIQSKSLKNKLAFFQETAKRGLSENNRKKGLLNEINEKIKENRQ